MGLAPHIKLKCGQCIGCRLERSTTWATRCWHHAQLYQQNAFITLTLDDAKIDQARSLDHRLWQLFMKKLRRRSDAKLSYYMAGEYTPSTQRPHYHACIFNYDFQDKKYWKKTKGGFRLYTSELLEKIWGHGFTSTGDVTFESAAYIARYIVAKITGPNSERFYERIDETTGEIYQLKPEYNRMSLNPAIGKPWLEKYTADVYPEGQVLIRNSKIKAPKYYDSQYEKAEPENHKQMLKARNALMQTLRGDNTPRRLAAKEKVKLAQVNQLLRTL